MLWMPFKPTYPKRVGHSLWVKCEHSSWAFVGYSGAPQNPYPFYFESQGARQAQAALALQNSPYGFSQGKNVPETSLPTWNGRLPSGIRAGSTPFRKRQGHLPSLVWTAKHFIRQTRVRIISWPAVPLYA